MVRSAKGQFIVGADITEFGEAFKQSDEQLGEWLAYCNKIFSDIEDLPFPTITAINGLALGGGCEMALSTDFRLIDTKRKIVFQKRNWESSQGLVAPFVCLE